MRTSSSAARFLRGVAEPTAVTGEGDLLCAEAAPRLVVVSGSVAGTAVELCGDETTLGRATTNDVVLPDSSVSRRHALLRRDPGGYLLLDQGSANGTRLNGRTVDAARLRSGDEIAVGDAVLQFVAAGRVAARAKKRVRRFEEVLAPLPLVETIRRPRVRLTMAASLLTPLLAVAAAALPRAKHPPNEEAPSSAVDTTVASTQAAESAAPPVAVETVPAAEPPRTTRPATHESAPTPRRAAVFSPSGVEARARRAYAAGDLAKAIALARGIPRARQLLVDLETFGSAWREGLAHAADRRTAEAIAAMERAEVADAVIGVAKGGAFSQKVRKTLSSLHAQLAAAQLDGGELAPAAAHLRSALRYDPRDERARFELERIVALANDAYLRGYVAKDIDEGAARDAFRTAVAVLPATDATAQKARRWLERLDGKAGEED
ncbi:MAG TPA: FHA domain-containing protein [Myxococcales bacterium]|nr:FHA domain-containing protein [Myxococcales bacterium]